MKLINLELGCGEGKHEGFVGIDSRELPGVDIIHNLEEFPWPVESNSCKNVIARHLLEHIDPRLSIKFIDEIWRCLDVDGVFAAVVPYPGSKAFWQDPTHCNGWNEVTFQYFDPRYPLYQLYYPKPWKIAKGFPAWQEHGILEVMMIKIPEESEGKTLSVDTMDTVGLKEVTHG